MGNTSRGVLGNPPLGDREISGLRRFCTPRPKRLPDGDLYLYCVLFILFDFLIVGTTNVLTFCLPANVNIASLLEHCQCFTRDCP